LSLSRCNGNAKSHRKAFSSSIEAKVENGLGFCQLMEKIKMERKTE